MWSSPESCHKENYCWEGTVLGHWNSFRSASRGHLQVSSHNIKQLATSLPVSSAMRKSSSRQFPFMLKAHLETSRCLNTHTLHLFSLMHDNLCFIQWPGTLSSAYASSKYTPIGSLKAAHVYTQSWNVVFSLCSWWKQTPRCHYIPALGSGSQFYMASCPWSKWVLGSFNLSHVASVSIRHRIFVMYNWQWLICLFYLDYSTVEHGTVARISPEL